MLRLAADENLNGEIVRGLWRRDPRSDIFRVQDASLLGAHDPTILEWSSIEDLLLLTAGSETAEWEGIVLYLPL